MYIRYGGSWLWICEMINVYLLLGSFSVGRRGELGDGLGTFGDGVSGEFTGKEELDSGLDFPRGEGSSLVESDQLGGFEGDSLEGVIDERVHDVHCLLGDTNVGVDLLQHLEDVDSESLWSFLLVLSSGGGDILHLLFNCSGSFLGSHFRFCYLLFFLFSFLFIIPIFALLLTLFLIYPIDPYLAYIHHLIG